MTIENGRSGQRGSEQRDRFFWKHIESENKKRFKTIRYLTPLTVPHSL